MGWQIKQIIQNFKTFPTNIDNGMDKLILNVRHMHT
jgi:hypothetical protein